MDQLTLRWKEEADGAYVERETGAIVWYDHPSSADAGYVLRLDDEDIPLNDATDDTSALREAEEIILRRLAEAEEIARRRRAGYYY